MGMFHEYSTNIYLPGGYSSAVVSVIKKDVSIRMCINYRQLNAKTIPKCYKIPRHEDLFDDFSDVEVFTVLDLSSAYWHIPLLSGL